VLTTVERGNGVCTRGLPITCASSTTLLDSIQSVAKHATVTLDGNQGVLSDRAA
jgi:hypothetical protein